MRHHGRRDIAFAAALAMLAGYVDAIGFLGMGGLFVSFMSGNSTRLSVGLATGAGDVALHAGGLIAAFVTGVVLATLLARRSGARRRPAVLLLVTVLLVLAGIGPLGPGSTMLLLAAAMGAENATFEREGEVAIAVTYMTGTLVKLGQHLATAIGGGARFGWVRYLCLWGGLVAGATAGALGFAALGLAAVWVAAAAALSLTLVAAVAPVGGAP